MKKLLLFLLLPGSILAQGNLQFNQVINVSINDEAEWKGKTIGTLVVPSGKVFKLESAVMYYKLTAPYTNNYSANNYNPNKVYNSLIIYQDGAYYRPEDYWLAIGDNIVWSAPYMESSSSNNTIHNIYEPKFPIWFGEGTYYIEASIGYFSDDGMSYTFKKDIQAVYSGIEFNVVN